MVGYYDLVLGAIPAALIGITAAMITTGFSTTTAIPTASIVVLGLMGHAMFVNAPGDPRTVETSRDPETPQNAGMAPPNAD